MKTCLSRQAADASRTSRRRCRQLRRRAAGKKGDERKAFMKECLADALAT